MQVDELLQDGFGRIRARLAQACGGLDADGLAWRPDPDANSIAWLVWHLTRAQDRQVAALTGTGQAWIEEGWHERFGMEADPQESGYGHTSEQVAAVRPESPDVLIDYYDATVRRTMDYLAGLTPEDLAPVIDRNYDPPVTVGVRLVSILGECFQHLGQASYVRGLLDRRG